MCKGCGQWREIFRDKSSNKIYCRWLVIQGCFRDATSDKSRGAQLSPTGKFGKLSYAPVTAHVHIPSRVLPQLGGPSRTSGHSALRFAGSPFTTSQLPAVSDRSLCKVKKWYWDEMDHFCNRDGWVFKYACLLLALFVSICGHSYSSTCTNIYGAWPPLTCAEACFVSFSLSCSGKHLRVSQDTSLKQPEQLPGL